MRALRADLRLAWELTRGADRGEWWRAALTALGAAPATALALAAVVLASLRGSRPLPFAAGILDQPGTRAGVVLGLLLLLLPVLGFVGQCARIGAVHRDRRLAGLRLAGATPWQVRRIAALETGLACALGSAVATVPSVLFLARLRDGLTAPVLAAVAVVAVAVPVLGAAAGALALRRVVASPLGSVRRTAPRAGRGSRTLFLCGLLLAAVSALLTAVTAVDAPHGSSGGPPLPLAGLVVAAGAGAVWLSAATARVTGRILAVRARSAATLIAAERLRDDPWSAARTHAAVLLVTVAGTGFLGIRRVLADVVRDRPDASYYLTGLNLTGAAVAVAFALTLSGLAVGTAESVAGRRRGLAAQVAAGVPRAVLGRALLLETALPLAPALLLAGLGGTASGAWYAELAGRPVPWAIALVPLAAYAACLLAAAGSLPLLRRSVRPGELRYA
ncbi:FtsX-like permease family protein [Streptomyces sp. NPDC057838]|uniref:FtsX-like permease family protein n=1 Tax=unclassified Streptomyces TaxID=2593676 RepID=UPI0036762E3F